MVGLVVCSRSAKAIALLVGRALILILFISVQACEISPNQVVYFAEPTLNTDSKEDPSLGTQEGEHEPADRVQVQRD